MKITKREIYYFIAIGVIGLIGLGFTALAYKVYDYTYSVVDGVMIISGYAEITIVPMIIVAVACFVMVILGLILGLGELLD